MGPANWRTSSPDLDFLNGDLNIWIVSLFFYLSSSLVKQNVLEFENGLIIDNSELQVAHIFVKSKVKFKVKLEILRQS